MPIYEAATIDEALQLGLKNLGLDKEEVEIEILDEGKKGFLGIGRKNAQLKIEPSISETISEAIEETVEEVLEEPSEKTLEETETTETTETFIEEKSKEVQEEVSELGDEAALTELAAYLTNITKQLEAPALVKIKRETNLIVFQLETQKQGILIGKHGKTLNALQYLAQVFIHRMAKNKLSVVVNVGNYREKRQEIIQCLADRTAEKAIRTGQPVFLEPMPAFERKQIHAVLSKNEYVKTHSEGDEPYRYLVVEPVKKRLTVSDDLG
ncbi:RNA-binding cell elongation regulator Jag/EloR [Enterococcus villorum]|uniref:RNA-binding cell elongation regulator Jag/EloR n=1 Tax=Enterococcus villorum TaxID=112904 RepID=UPI003F89B948